MIPLKYLQDLPALELRDYFSQTFDMKWTLHFREKVVERILITDSEEISSINCEEFLGFIEKLSKIKGSVNKDSVFVRLAFCNLLLQGSNITNRFLGLVEITKVIEKNGQNQIFSEQIVADQLLTTYLKSLEITKFVLRNCHLELLKKSFTLFHYLASQKSITKDEIEVLWKTGQNLSAEESVFDLFSSISFYLAEDLQVLLYEITKNQGNVTEKYLKFLIDLTRRIGKKGENSGLQILFGLIFESDLQACARNYFIELLKGSKSVNVFYAYIDHLIQHLLDEFQVCESILTLLEMMKINFEACFACTRTEIFAAIDEKINGFWEKIENYLKLLLSGELKSSDPKLDSMKIAIKLWKFTIKSHNYKVSPLEIHHFYQSVKSCPLPQAETLFLKSLNKMVKSKFQLTQKQDLFEMFFLSLHPDQIPLTEQKFDLFFELFIQVNKENNLIEIKGKEIFSRLSERLIGYEKLLECLFSSENQKIYSKCLDLITVLNVKLSKSLFPQKLSIWSGYLKSVAEHIQKDNLNVIKALKLLAQFLGTTRNKPEGPLNATVKFYMISDKELNSFEVNEKTTTIGHVKEKLSEFYQKNTNCILLQHNNEVYNYLADNVFLHTLKTPWTFLVNFDKKVAYLSPSEFLMSQEEFLINLLKAIKTFSQEAARIAWNVLCKCWPVNSLYTQIEEMLIPFDLLLPFDCIYSLVYNLKIMLNLSSNSNWIKIFYENEGFSYIIRVFIDFTPSPEDPNPLVLDYFSQIFNFLKQSPNFPVSLVYKILDSLVKLSKFHEESEQLITICIIAKEILSKIQKNCLTSYQSNFSTYPLHDLIIEVFINCEFSILCSTVSNFLLEHSNFTPSISQLIITELLNTLPLAIQKPNRDIYWGLVRCYIKELKDPEKLQQTFEYLIRTLDTYPPELSSEQCDSNLVGLLSVLALIMPSPIPQEVFIQIHSLIFRLPKTQSENFPKCKSRLSKKEAFELIKIMITQSSEAFDYLLTQASGFSKDLSFRTCKSSDWQISSQDSERPFTGFVGLKNLGCICYLNSCIQQLFCIDPFKQFILSYAAHGSESILYQLQVTFSALQHSIQPSFEPKDLCNTLLDWEGKPLNIQEQQDADEFINSFLDKILYQIPAESFNIVHELLSGTLVTEIKGEEDCEHVRKIQEKFFTLPIQVKNQGKLESGLKEFVSGEVLEGANAYQCDSCGRKVRAVRRVLVNSLPKVLIITLRRFEFNYEIMRRVKLNDFCEFPNELDMTDYTSDELGAQEKEYFQYRIKGVLVHLGTAESGHYYSYIRNEDSWFEFNDALVVPFDPKDLSQEAFGGYEGISSKQKSAYILFYERINYSKNLPEPGPETSFASVSEENQRFCRTMLSFSSEYIDFIMDLLHINLSKTIQFVIKTFFTLVIRSADCNRIVNIAIRLKEILGKNQEYCDWTLYLISHPAVIKELFLDCPAIEKRKIMVGVVKAAVLGGSSEALFLFTYRWIGSLPRAKVPLSFNFCNYFEVLLACIRVMPEIITLFSLHSRLVEYVKGDEILVEIENVEEKVEEDVLGYLGTKKAFTTEELSKSELGESLEYLSGCLESCSIYYEDLHLDILLSESTLRHFVEGCKNKSCSRSIAKLYTSLVNNNKLIFIHLAKLFSSLLRQYTCSDLIPSSTSEKSTFFFTSLMRIFYHVILSLKQIFPEKMEEVLTILMNITLERLQNNQDPHCILVYVKKILINDNEIKKILNKRQKILKEVENFLSSAWYNYQTSNKDINRLKFCIENFQIIKKLAKNEIKTVFDEDSDLELRDFETCPGSELLLYSHELNSWIRTTVTINCAELICVRYENSSTQKWLDPRSDLLHRV